MSHTHTHNLSSTQITSCGESHTEGGSMMINNSSSKYKARTKTIIIIIMTAIYNTYTQKTAVKIHNPIDNNLLFIWINKNNSIFDVHCARRMQLRRQRLNRGTYAYTISFLSCMHLLLLLLFLWMQFEWLML